MVKSRSTGKNRGKLVRDAKNKHICSRCNGGGRLAAGWMLIRNRARAHAGYGYKLPAQADGWPYVSEFSTGGQYLPAYEQ
ncbi:hypothetical protein GCM10022398_03910 [Acetobacter lovaniensis]